MLEKADNSRDSVASIEALVPELSPRTARSILVTIIGEFVFPSPEPVWTSAFISAAGMGGVNERAARQSIARAAAAGWLSNIKDGRRVAWTLTTRGRAMIESGMKRGHAVREGGEAFDGNWLVLHITLPDSRRSDRLKIYRRLVWLGFGSPTPGLWVCPHVDRWEAIQKTVEELELSQNTIAYSARPLPFGMTDEVLVRKAWDLDRIAASYDSLIDYFNSVRPKGRSSVFAADLELLNVMMRLPSIDPGLPGVLLPKDWPGRRAVSLFRKLRTRWRDQAHSFWDDLLKAE